MSDKIYVTNTDNKPRRLSWRMPNGQVGYFLLAPRAKEIEITVPSDSLTSFMKQQEKLVISKAIIFGKVSDSKASKINEENRKKKQKTVDIKSQEQVESITQKAAEDAGVNITITEEKIS